MTLDLHYQELVTSLTSVGLAPGSTPLIPDFTLTTELIVKYNQRIVSPGNLFRASECKIAPQISFAGEDLSKTYTLLLVDPDAPTPEEPKFAYWRHWVFSGLQPSPIKNELSIATKPALTEYLGPGPKDESTPHRYLFLLYKEPDNFALSKEDVGGEEFVDRRSFKAVEWVQKAGLELVGLSWMLGAGDGWNGTLGDYQY